MENPTGYTNNAVHAEYPGAMVGVATIDSGFPAVHIKGEQLTAFTRVGYNRAQTGYPDLAFKFNADGLIFYDQAYIPDSMTSTGNFYYPTDPIYHKYDPYQDLDSTADYQSMIFAVRGSNYSISFTSEISFNEVNFPKYIVH